MLRVSVACATAETQEQVSIALPQGATVADAINASGFAGTQQVDAARLRVGIFGARARLDRKLADGDRVEILRPLIADPKEARRARAKANPRLAARPAPREGKSGR